MSHSGRFRTIDDGLLSHSGRLRVEVDGHDRDHSTKKLAVRMKDKSVQVDGPRILVSGRIKVDGLKVLKGTC